MRTIPVVESLEVEFKSDLKCYPDHDLIEEIVGMTNTIGGVLFLGVEDDGTIKTANDNSDHGNSGGPVFAEKDGKYVVVGILVGANKGSDSMKGRVVPIANAL